MCLTYKSVFEETRARNSPPYDDDSSSDPNDRGLNKRKHTSFAKRFLWVAHLERASARKAGNPSSNPVPGDNFFSFKIINHVPETVV